MGTQYMPSSSGSYDYGTGKYRLKLEYSYTNNSFSFTPSLTIVKGFGAAISLTFKWLDENGKWQQYVSAGCRSEKTFTFNTRNVSLSDKNNNSLQVKMQFGTDKWRVFDAVAHNVSLYTPTIKAEKISDADVEITVSGSATSTKYGTLIRIQRKEDDGSFADFTTVSKALNTDYTITRHDTTVTTGHKYQYRARLERGETHSAYSSNSDWVYTTPSSSELSGDPVATRVDNNTVNVTWALSSVTPVQIGNVSKFQVKRSTNGGAFNNVGDPVPAVTSTVNYTFTDDTCAKDNTYKYAVDILNKAGTSLYSPIQAENTIRMTPTEPQMVSLALDSDNIPILTMSNVSNSATKVLIERKENSSAWAQEEELEYPASTFEGAVVEAGDTVKYRVRNYVDDSTITPSTDRYSAYVEAGAGGGAGAGGVSVETKSKPNPPTLTSPLNGSKYCLDEGTLLLMWTHNPTDGSAQESATIQYQINSGSWQTITVTTAHSYSLNISSMSANDVISWKVSTRGAFATASDYSAVKTVTLLSRPTIAFTSPNNAAVISTLPIVLGWNYSDLSGTLVSLKADIKKDEKTVLSVSVPVGAGTSGAYSYTLSDFLPDNNSQYSIAVEALSSSGLSATQTIGITVSYQVVTITGGLVPSALFDEETSYASVRISRDITDGASPINVTTAWLYRVSDGKTELVESGLNEFSTVEDRYAPVGIDYTYKLLQQFTNGIGITEVVVRNESPYWYVLWGNNVARAKWNPQGSASLDRPERTEVRYSGREYPVSYDSNAQEETYSFSTTILERAELNSFRQMMRDGGQGIWKSGDGECYDANFTFDYSADFTTNSRAWDCSVEVTRIDGGDA